MPAALPVGMRAALARCDAPVSGARCLPPAAYVTAEMQAAEAAAVFSRGWVPAGRADRVRGTGDYATLEIAGHPVILLRDTGGTLRAFANTCRHRGARLLDGAGTTRGIRCPFHAWLYRLDGTLAAAPRLDGAEGFATADHGLHPHAVAERLGFVFLSFAPDPPDIDAWLGDFAAHHADWPLADLVSARSWTREFDMDWKAFLDVFNEYYHLPHVHRHSIDGVYGDPDPGEAVTGAFASQFGATEGTGGLLESQQAHALPPMPGLAGRARSGVRYTWVFPSMSFACGPEALWLYEATPAGPGRARVTQTACFHLETMALPGFDMQAAEYYRRLDTALDEDIPALENQQRGLAAPEAAQGPFAPTLEPNVAAFARWYARRMMELPDA